jgi:hypothetical protein
MLWFGKLQRSLGSFSNTGKSWNQEKVGICVEWWQRATEFSKEGGQGHVFVTKPTKFKCFNLGKTINPSSLSTKSITWLMSDLDDEFREPKNVFSLHMRGGVVLASNHNPPIPAHTLEASKWVCGPIVGTSNSKGNFGRWIGLGILSSVRSRGLKVCGCCLVWFSCGPTSTD